ncbi:c-type cytochrome [Phenylobacterium sp.]|uniref:c-type cytochrome n=1 Tax=Phenylobacterium sp. TaxID=1871053 RepID=UPI001227C85E|nr:c-type cytochrome [Phenylobacterium sp.]THD73121.1 MAG: c-type cytochrome [Phenylobacterium sp.]
MSLRRPSATLWLAALAAAAATSAMAQPATPPADFAVCTACHEVKPGGVSLGPTLFGVAGRKAGSVPDFDYSPALKAWGMSWTPENLQAFILDPAKTVPNNKMDYSGAADAATAKAIADYLATLKP